MALCNRCHREAPPGALFCAFCGAPMLPEQAGGPEADPLIGQTFRGVYFIQQKIGVGGMGVVYKAVHVTLDVPVALKILKKALLSDPSVVQRFHREARSASRLRHPNVINVTDFGQTDDGALFMVMEFVAGKSLATVIAEESPLSEQRIVRIGAQVLAALAEAHANQILHRDLKPENVMIEARREEPDSVKVLDFGIAKVQAPGEGQSVLTQAGLVCGTPGYMSPEQWTGDPLDARSDLYAVGVILYEMLTGKPPFEVATPMEMVRKHLTERPLPPSARLVGRGVSPDLEALVMRALSADRDERPPSAEEMRADLLACVLLPEPSDSPRPGTTPKTMVLERERTPPPRAGAAPAPPRAGAAPAPRAPAGVESLPTSVGTPAPVTPKRTPSKGPAAPPPPTPRPGAAGARTRPPTPGRGADAPSAPRHEEDEVQEVAPPPETATGRSRKPLLLGGAGVALLAAVAILLARGGGPPPPALALERASPASGPTAGGISVVLDGSGFAPHSAVRFGKTPADVTGATETSLTVRTPTHAAGPVDVVVSNPDGRTAKLAGGFTYVAPPPLPPTVSGISPDSGPTAGGTEVELTGSEFAPGAEVTFGGEAAKVLSAKPTTLVVRTPDHSPGRADVVVSNPDGQRWTLSDGFEYVAPRPTPQPRREPRRPSPSPPPSPPPPRREVTVIAVKDALNAMPTPSAITGDGVISVQVEPFGDVYLEGKPYGLAPREFRVPAGSYLLRAVHPQLGRQEKRVEVRAGERVRWVAVFAPKP